MNDVSASVTLGAKAEGGGGGKKKKKTEEGGGGGGGGGGIGDYSLAHLPGGNLTSLWRGPVAGLLFVGEDNTPTLQDLTWC